MPQVAYPFERGSYRPPDQLRAYRDLFLDRLGVEPCRRDKLTEFDKELDQFISEHHLNIEWYTQAIEHEERLRRNFATLSVGLSLTIPIAAVILSRLASSPASALLGALLFGLTAIHKSLSNWLEKRRVVALFWNASSTLKEQVYDFESQWSHRLSQYEVLPPGFLNQLRERTSTAREVVRRERAAFFEFAERPTFDLTAVVTRTLPQSHQGVRGRFADIEPSPDSVAVESPSTDFVFDATFTPEQVAQLRMCHDLAYSQVNACTCLAPEEKRRLRERYLAPIHHSRIYGSADNAHAIVGLDKIWINVDELFPKGEEEIAQTLIHEMMHCAGYSHSARTANDQPGDRGLYYGSPPLRAELCIAGRQSSARSLA